MTNPMQQALRRNALNTHPAIVAGLPQAQRTGIKVEVLRKGGKGIEGTYANIDHHALEMAPFVNAIAPKILTMDLARWRQGHNIHVFETHDGRTFDMVPLRKNGYIGVRLRLHVSRSHKVTLCDCTSVNSINQMITVMRELFAEPSDAEVGGGIADSCK